MYVMLIVVHVVAMIISLVLMPAAILLALRGVHASLKVATAGIVTTGVGFFAGMLLLLSAPLLSECAILTSYLLAMIAVYAFGFGWGVESRARFLKKA